MDRQVTDSDSVLVFLKTKTFRNYFLLSQPLNEVHRAIFHLPLDATSRISKMPRSESQPPASPSEESVTLVDTASVHSAPDMRSEDTTAQEMGRRRNRSHSPVIVGRTPPPSTETTRAGPLVPSAVVGPPAPMNPTVPSFGPRQVFPMGPMAPCGPPFLLPPLASYGPYLPMPPMAPYCSSQAVQLPPMAPYGRYLPLPPMAAYCPPQAFQFPPMAPYCPPPLMPLFTGYGPLPPPQLTPIPPRMYPLLVQGPFCMPFFQGWQISSNGTVIPFSRH